MKRLVIEIPEPGDERYQRCGFDVVDEQGRRANGLNFDEMLGQIVSITHPKLDGKPQYQMQTAEQWQARQLELDQRLAARASGAPALDDVPY